MNRVASIALLPLSGLYGAAVKARFALYKAGIFREQRVGVPVISVGNITAGGTGKTPLVEWIARSLAHEGRRSCILTRGYGRENENERVIASDGKAILTDISNAGDEAFLLAEKLLGKVAVVSDADRFSAARWAIENLGSDIFILDDGFQNIRVSRDLNIVTIDASRPWDNERLLPAGLLREPRSGLSRADCIVITRADQSNSLEELRHELERFSNSRPVFLSRMKLMGLRLLPNSNEKQNTQVENDLTPFAAFCGIGNPESFFSQLRNSGRVLSYTRAFPDHHQYTQSDIDELCREAMSRGARALLTTAKDEVKLRSLRFDLPCYVVDIEIKIDDDDKLKGLIDRAIQGVGLG